MTATTAHDGQPIVAPAAARKRAAALIASLITPLLLAGCGSLPPFPALPDAGPDEVRASNIVPDPSGLEDTPGSLVVDSPDGFTPAERMSVRIRNVGCTALSTGSGFALDDHTIITNRHVIEGMRELEMSTYDGRSLAVADAGVTEYADLAIVTTVEAMTDFPVLRDSDPEEGEPVQVVGYPAGGRLTITTGTVLGAVEDPLNSNLGKVFVTDAEVEPGSSGSAAFDADGQIIGVVYAKADENRSLLVPVSLLRRLLDDSAFTPLASCQ
ncbi:MAG: serine protease [Cellulomonadaceae bacterium]|jgi:hypothetical protein|nr:serine protease [Cellulomonadaceae bacterium]